MNVWVSKGCWPLSTPMKWSQWLKIIETTTDYQIKAKYINSLLYIKMNICSLKMIVAFPTIRTSIMYKCSKFKIVLNLLEMSNYNIGESNIFQICTGEIGSGRSKRGATRHAYSSNESPRTKFSLNPKIFQAIFVNVNKQSAPLLHRWASELV